MRALLYVLQCTVYYVDALHAHVQTASIRGPFGMFSFSFSHQNTYVYVSTDTRGGTYVCCFFLW